MEKFENITFMTKQLIKNNTWLFLGLLLTLIVSYMVFKDVFAFQVYQFIPSNNHWVSDTPVHTQLILKFAAAGQFPAYSLWYILVYSVSGFSTNFDTLATTTIILLTFFVGLKYLTNYYIINDCGLRGSRVIFISLAMIFVMPIISYYDNSYHIYLGNISPNQWHNSTLILAMPFNLLFFYYSVKNINSIPLKNYAIMSLLGIVSILCKPNFALAFLPVLCIGILVVNRKNHLIKNLLNCSVIAVPAILLLIFQWYITYIHSDLFANQSTIFAPFKAWGQFSPHILQSFLLSIAFPLTLTAFFYKKIDKYLIFSWLAFLVSMLMVSLLSEHPDSAGNFFWGPIACNYVLFLFSAKLLLEQQFDLKAKILWTIFGIHLASGIFKLADFFINETSLIV